MQELPLVSIVTPSYNQGRFIEETIVSVITQDYPCIEYIVMDGGSNDQTLDILRNYTGQVAWYSERDRGQSAAINKGLRLAKGEILAYLNSDDTYLPGAITRAVHYLTVENPDLPFVYGEGYHITAEGSIIERYPTEPFNFGRLVETCYICQPTTFWKRDVMDTIGLFNENLHFALDYEYWIRIAKQYGTLGYLPEYLANSRLYQETKTLSKQFEANEERLNVIRDQFGKGNIPPALIYAYAHYFMDRFVSRENGSKKALFMLGKTMIAALKFLEYNYTLPLSDVKQWKEENIDPLFSRGVL